MSNLGKQFSKKSTVKHRLKRVFSPDLPVGARTLNSFEAKCTNPDCKWDGTSTWSVDYRGKTLTGHNGGGENHNMYSNLESAQQAHKEWHKENNGGV